MESRPLLMRPRQLVSKLPVRCFWLSFEEALCRRPLIMMANNEIEPLAGSLEFNVPDLFAGPRLD